MRRSYQYGTILVWLALIVNYASYSQLTATKERDTVFFLDFGIHNQSFDKQFVSYRGYTQVTKNCPTDGRYSFAPFTYNCFAGKWITLTEDHTEGDEAGNMMIVNASEQQGEFLRFTIGELQPGRSYEFAAWLINLYSHFTTCGNGQQPLIPHLIFYIETLKGKLLAKYQTGDIKTQEIPQWQKSNFKFTLPSTEKSIVVRIATKNPGGCANDFAIDDISLTEFNSPEIKKIETPATTRHNPEIKNLENPLIVRENPVIKSIESGTQELLVELFDNGIVDGDTVSVYHNNILVLDKQPVSTKAISIKIKVDKDHPRHELVMVAENLGSIPPNTALLVIHAKDKKHEAFISTDARKNARIVINWKQ